VVLYGNELTGAVPESLFQLPLLVELWLNHNKLSGELPAMGAMKSLQRIDLSNNQFTGELPPDFRDLAQLIDFLFANSRLLLPPPSNNDQCCDAGRGKVEEFIALCDSSPKDGL